MAFKTIVNLVLIAIILICGWQGYKKGLFMGIIEVLVIILSLYGAQVLSNTFSGDVVSALKPFVSGYMESRIEKNAYSALGYQPDENGDYGVSLSLEDLLAQNPGIVHTVCSQSFISAGCYSTVADGLATKAEQYAAKNGESIPDAVVDVLCQNITWVAGFVLFFLIVFILLTVIVNIPNLGLRLPYIGIANDIGGAAIGVINGLLYCAVILWIVQYCGLLISEDKIRTASVAAFFVDHNLLTHFITF